MTRPTIRLSRRYFNQNIKVERCAIGFYKRLLYFSGASCLFIHATEPYHGAFKSE